MTPTLGRAQGVQPVRFPNPNPAASRVPVPGPAYPARPRTTYGAGGPAPVVNAGAAGVAAPAPPPAPSPAPAAGGVKLTAASPYRTYQGGAGPAPHLADPNAQAPAAPALPPPPQMPGPPPWQRGPDVMAGVMKAGLAHQKPGQNLRPEDILGRFYRMHAPNM